jgi:hypothetical protein
MAFSCFCFWILLLVLPPLLLYSCVPVALMPCFFSIVGSTRFAADARVVRLLFLSVGQPRAYDGVGSDSSLREIRDGKKAEIGI